MNKHVLISGAGVAGPALALSLERHGFRSTVVERAHALRRGGQAVDFRGPVHRDVLERLDLWDAIHERRTRPSKLVFLDSAGLPCATMPEVMMSGDVEIFRGDLSQLLYERTAKATEYRFGDRVVALDDDGERVTATFEHAAPQTFDFVVGADGLHSGVRKLVVGDEAKLLRHHGYRIATFSMPSPVESIGSAVTYTVPGRAVCVTATSATEARALLVYEAEALDADRSDVAAQKRALRQIFAGIGWRVPEVLDALDCATDLYVDAIATVHVDRYADGRIALLGDAAWGGTLGGQGTSLAIVGAYVLAGELARTGDHVEAFARFERKMRPYATRCQNGATRAGQFFAPKTRVGLALRNAIYGFLTSPKLLWFFEWMVKDAASDLALPEYSH